MPHRVTEKGLRCRQVIYAGHPRFVKLTDMTVVGQFEDVNGRIAGVMQF